MATNGNPNKLTPRQRRAIATLLSERDVKAAALAAGVGYRSLCRWMDNPTFRAALLAAEGDSIDTATRRLIGLQDGAIDTLHEVLADKSTSPGTRLRAATSVLDYLLKLRELRDIEKRLHGLEEIVFGEHG